MSTFHCHKILSAIRSSLIALCAASALSGCGFLGFAPTEPDPAPNPNARKVVSTACSQIGKKYCPGGSSPGRGFDCSGLIWWSYRQNGLNVPRITTAQAKIGKPVHKKHIRAGDIVVFKTGQSPRGLHTGIYAGKGSFVHSPSQGKKVCLEKLSHPYWNGRLVAIRRIVR